LVEERATEKREEIPGPRPRPARPVICAIISIYSAGFIFFLMGWMKGDGARLVLGVVSIFTGCGLAHYFVLRFRQRIYDYICRLFRSEVSFFEFPFFGMVAVLYLFSFMVLPAAFGMLTLDHGAADFLTEENLIMYILFGGGAILVVSAISGMDVYPVNTFGTRAALEELISITRDLMKACNRTLVLVSGSVIVGWAFKKVEFSPLAVYITAYAVAGFAIGTTAVLGARLTELLYKLSDMERAEAKHQNEVGSAQPDPKLQNSIQ
jgi:hypothetical protein